LKCWQYDRGQKWSGFDVNHKNNIQQFSQKFENFKESNRSEILNVNDCRVSLIVKMKNLFALPWDDFRFSLADNVDWAEWDVLYSWLNIK